MADIVFFLGISNPRASSDRFQREWASMSRKSSLPRRSGKRSKSSQEAFHGPGVRGHALVPSIRYEVTSLIKQDSINWLNSLSPIGIYPRKPNKRA